MPENRTKILLEKTLRQIAYWRLWPNVPTRPLILHVEPSGACNLKCLICPQSVSEKKPVREFLMDMALYNKVLDYAKGFFYEIYFAAGGEPLLHPNLPEMVRMAVSAGLMTTLHTNVTLLTREKAVALIEAGLHRISLNIIDSKEEYEQVRGGASFEKSVQNIKSFLEVKKELGRNPFTTLQVVKPHRHGDNKRQPRIDPEFLKHFEELPVDRTLCFWAHHFGGDFADRSLLKYDEPQRADRYFPCQELWIALMVAHDGTVHPCCIDLQGTYTIGSIRENSLRELWNSEKMVRLRCRLAQGHYTNLPLCRNCQLLWRETIDSESLRSRLYNIIFYLFAKKVRPQLPRDNYR